MKQAETLGFNGRSEKMQTLLDQNFNVNDMMRTAAGPSWTSASPSQQQLLVQSFRTFTAATYASRFSHYSGEQFQVLDEKPAVKIPADFAARVTAQLPEKHSTPAGTRSSTPHWGLITAIVLVTCGMIGTAIADPSGLTTRMGIIFLLIVASEIAGIALWLGIGRSGERPRW